MLVLELVLLAGLSHVSWAEGFATPDAGQNPVAGNPGAAPKGSIGCNELAKTLATRSSYKTYDTHFVRQLSVPGIDTRVVWGNRTQKGVEIPKDRKASEVIDMYGNLIRLKDESLMQTKLLDNSSNPYKKPSYPNYYVIAFWDHTSQRATEVIAEVQADKKSCKIARIRSIHLPVGGSGQSTKRLDDSIEVEAAQCKSWSRDQWLTKENARRTLTTIAWAEKYCELVKPYIN